MRVEARVLKGFRDYLPEVEGPRQAMLGKVKAVFESFGYGPLMTPALEYSDILLGKYGDEGDKLLYRFTDNGERDVALRYDLTVPLARVVASYGDLVMPWRRYQVAPVWRAEKPARGRFREFVQCDVDLVGEPSVRADAEIMMVGLSVLEALSVPRFVMRVNDRRILDGVLDKVGVAVEQRIAVLRIVDKLPKVGRAEVDKEIASTVGLAQDKIDALFALLVPAAEVPARKHLEHLQAELADSAVGQAGLAGLTVLLETLANAGFAEKVDIDLTIARGLDYYTSTIYETFLVGHEGFGSVMSGGRYDTLLDMFTSRSIPAVGISLGVDRLLAALLELGLIEANKAPADAFFCLFSEADYAHNAALATALRKVGVKVELSLSAGKLGKQFQLATKKGHRFALLQGEGERAAKQVVLKNLGTGEQETLPCGDEVALKALATRIASSGAHDGRP
jgi:histidyl-tRNA synthetase